MPQTLNFLAFSTAVVLAAGPGRAAECVLCTDDLQAGDTAGFQQGFGVGEEAAVRLSSPGVATLVRVQLAYGGGEIPGEGFNETLRIYDDDGTGELESVDAFPGTVLAEQEAPCIDSDTDATEIALVEPLRLPETGFFWVSLVAGHGGGPFVARDAGGYDATSAIHGDIGVGGVDWWDNETAGVPGDWVIRAVVETDVPIDDTACRFAAVVSEGEGEGGEGEGEEGEGEGEEGEGEEGEGEEGEGEGAEGEGEDGLVVTGVVPASAPFGEAVDVVVLGSGFVDGVSVRFGSEVLDGIVVDNDNTLRARTHGTATVGTYDVIVQNGADVFTFPSGFTVTPIDEVAEGEGEAPGGCGCNSVDAGASFVVVALLLRRRRPSL